MKKILIFVVICWQCLFSTHALQFDLQKISGTNYKSGMIVDLTQVKSITGVSYSGGTTVKFDLLDASENIIRYGFVSRNFFTAGSQEISTVAIPNVATGLSNLGTGFMNGNYIIRARVTDCSAMDTVSLSCKETVHNFPIVQFRAIYDATTTTTTTSTTLNSTTTTTKQASQSVLTLTSPLNQTDVTNSVTFGGKVVGYLGAVVSYTLLIGTTEVSAVSTSTSKSCINSYCTTTFSTFFKWDATSVPLGEQAFTLRVKDESGAVVTASRTLNVLKSVTTTSSSTSTTSTTASSTTTTGSTTSTTLLSPLTSYSISQGWNLLGFGLGESSRPNTLFGDKSKVTTVWKWIARAAKWAFYSPMLDDGGKVYSTEKGYEYLVDILPGDGYWVNAKTSFEVINQASTTLTASNANMRAHQGWNLLGQSGAGRLSTSAVLGDKEKVTTVWKWSANGSKWAFYSPLLEDGGKAYAAEKGYEHLTNIESGEGFWINAKTEFLINPEAKIDILLGEWPGLSNGRRFRSDSLDLSVTVTGSDLIITAEQFFDGTCIYKARLNIARDAVNAVNYQCSDFTSGTWSLIDMRLVDKSDVYILLQKDGKEIKRFYGLGQSGSNLKKVLSEPIKSFVGSYDAIATGGIFGSDTANNTQFKISGSQLTISVPYFFGGTCEYKAAIQPSGHGIDSATYSCADFTSGKWDLNELRSIGGDDFFLSITQNGLAKRIIGMR